MSDTDPTQAPADPSLGATPALPAKRPVSRWLTPLLAVVAALVIGLFGGILIGQHTGGTQQAGFTRPGGFGGGQGGTGQGGNGGFGGNGGQTGGQNGGGTGNGGTGNRPGGGQGGFAGGNFTAGTIQSVDGDTITLKLQDGSTVKVTTSGSTTVTKTDKAKVSDLSQGETIVVRGTKDSSGNVKATTVTEGQAGGFGARPGAGTGSGSGN
jgi:hypothetical protein